MPRGRFVIRRETDPVAFAVRAEPWLQRREAEHNVLLGLLPKLAVGRHEFSQPVYLATIERDGLVVGCAFRTPPHKFGLTRMPAGAEVPLAADVSAAYDTLPAVLGREEDATRFARAWCAQTGQPWSPGMRQRIHCLERLIEPKTRPSGSLRVAVDGERALVARWLDAFAQDTSVTRAPGTAMADILLADRHAFIWDDGGPRAIVAAPGFTPRGARIGYVYTPPDHRGRGYATAAVATLSRRLLDSGRRFCVLYTDLANPVSNGIYARLGYQPICDVVDLNFADTAEPSSRLTASVRSSRPGLL
jgi:hypothetical protein